MSAPPNIPAEHISSRPVITAVKGGWIGGCGHAIHTGQRLVPDVPAGGLVCEGCA